MAAKLSHRGTANRGAAAVELALLMPLLILIIFGMIEMGWLVMKQSDITNAARAGARYAAMPSVTNVSDVTGGNSPAIQVLNSNNLTPYATVTVGGSGVTPPVGNLVTVTVTLQYRSSATKAGAELLHFLTFALPDQLHATVSMAKEGPTS
jgi:Flp pilus assembly protein TadG